MKRHKNGRNDVSDSFETDIKEVGYVIVEENPNYRFYIRFEIDWDEKDIMGFLSGKSIYLEHAFIYNDKQFAQKVAAYVNLHKPALSEDVYKVFEITKKINVKEIKD